MRADARLPSVVLLVVGAPIKGSWWSHPQAHDIYAVCEGLNHHADAALAKLVSGKVTYVHRGLWPQLAAVGGAREGWQTERLSKAALALLELVTRAKALRTDQVEDRRLASSGAVTTASRELEGRLLVHAQDVHTEKGSHAKRLESWPAWAARVGVAAGAPAPAEARAVFETRVRTFAGPHFTQALLPWASARRA